MPTQADVVLIFRGKVVEPPRMSTKVMGKDFSSWRARSKGSCPVPSYMATSFRQHEADILGSFTTAAANRLVCLHLCMIAHGLGFSQN